MRYRIGLTLLGLFVGLSACRSLGAQQSPYNPYGCDKYSGICVSIEAEKDFIEMGEMLPVTVMVTSDQDQFDLLLVLHIRGYKLNRVTASFSEQNIIYDEQGDVIWQFDIYKNQPRVFRGTLLFNSAVIADPDVTVTVFREWEEVRVNDGFHVYFTESGGQVYYPGTKIPRTNVPLIETLYIYTYTPGPSPTWAPSATWPPRIATREALTQQAEPKTPRP